MADVTGSIGNEYVELNNAATEVTLKQVLAAIQKQGGTGAAGAVASTAGAAGVNAASVESAKAAAKAQKELGEKATTAAEKAANLTKTFSALASGMTELAGKLLQGTSNSSDLFAAFEKLPGAAGVVASVFKKVAQFQEENLEAYQKMSSAGINFGGSLTDMRTAAASTYMTLGEFGKVMKENAPAFARMGGSVNDGARAFVAISNTLNKSSLGTDLRALGYTSQEVNQGMIDYIAISGGRSRKEMQNTESLAKAGANYLENLDGLSKLTGESREALAAKMKQDAANEAWQGYLLTLDEAGREKAIKANLEAGARGGKGAAEALQARLMGLPPQTEAAQKFVGTLQNGNAAVNKLADDVTDSSKSLKDMDKTSAGVSVGMAKDGERLRGVGSALIMAGKGGEEMSKALGAANNATRNGIKTTEEQIAFEEKIAQESKAQKASEAKSAVEAQKAMQELGQTLLSALLPIIKTLTPVINGLAQVVKIIATQFEKLHGGLQLGILGIIAYVAAQKLQATAMAAKEAAAAAGGGGGGGGSKGGPKGSGGGGAKGALKGAMGSASKFAKLGGAAGAVLGAANLYNSFGDINDKVKSGKMSEEEASKEKAGVVGETGGGMAGGIAGAAAGAAIGSVVPIIGTVIGGLIGGALGSYGGSSLGKSAADSLTKPKLADGGIVSSPTNVTAGEAGPEAIAPLRYFENLQTELQTLNKQTAEVIRYLKETAESTRQTVDATRNLGGDLFKF